MLHHELLADQGILIVTPEGPLEAADFEALRPTVDAYLEDHAQLNGLMIYAERFPGWANFSGLISHLTFVRDHHRQIQKVAAVTDSGFLSILPAVAKHFVDAEVRHFDYAERAAALEWLTGGGS